MAKVTAQEFQGNRILGSLPAREYARLLPHLKLASLEVNQLIYEAKGLIDYVYFPTCGVISAVAVMEDGTAIEVATVGNEGMAGLPALNKAERSPHRLFVQVAGQAYKMSANVLQRETRDEGLLCKVLFRYQTAFFMQMSQSVACNGLHSIEQRCCRWLLITLDRVADDVIPLTHEFLSIMLGVRRPGVTEVLQKLQAKGYLRYHRGTITVLDRAGLENTSCECYRNVKTEYDLLVE